MVDLRNRITAVVEAVIQYMLAREFDEFAYRRDISRVSVLNTFQFLCIFLH